MTSRWERLVAVASWVVGAATIGKAGIAYAAAYTMSTGRVPSAWGVDNVLLSLWFTVPVLLTVAAHEWGHIAACRRYGVRTTWPVMLPLPIAWVEMTGLGAATGTAGAFVCLKDEVDRDDVRSWDIAFGGIAAGAVVTVATTVAASVVSTEGARASMMLEPLGMRIVTGELLRHPAVMAAWVGWLLTGISLVPIWPFDGGRLRAALPAAVRRRRVPILFVVLLCILSWV